MGPSVLCMNSTASGVGLPLGLHTYSSHQKRSHSAALRESRVSWQRRNNAMENPVRPPRRPSMSSSPTHLLTNSILIQTDDGRRFDYSIQHNRIVDDPILFRRTSRRSLRPVLGGLATVVAASYVYLLTSEDTGFSSLPLANVTHRNYYLGGMPHVGSNHSSVDDATIADAPRLANDDEVGDPLRGTDDDDDDDSPLDVDDIFKNEEDNRLNSNFGSEGNMSMDAQADVPVEPKDSPTNVSTDEWRKSTDDTFEIEEGSQQDIANEQKGTGNNDEQDNSAHASLGGKENDHIKTNDVG